MTEARPQTPGYLTPGTTLEQARRWVMERARKGVKCPCCGRHVQVYKRKLNRTMVQALHLMWVAGGTTEWRHAPTVLQGFAKEAKDVAKCALWDLIEEEKARRPDGGRSGWWRVTPEGEEFLKGNHAVHRYAVVYQDRVIDHTGDLVSVGEVSPRFRLDELLGTT